MRHVAGAVASFANCNEGISNQFKGGDNEKFSHWVCDFLSVALSDLLAGQGASHSAGDYFARGDRQWDVVRFPWLIRKASRNGLLRDRPGGSSKRRGLRPEQGSEEQPGYGGVLR